MRTLTYGTEMNKMFLTDRFFMSDMSVHRVWLRLSDYGQKDGTFVDMSSIIMREKRHMKNFSNRVWNRNQIKLTGSTGRF